MLQPACGYFKKETLSNKIILEGKNTTQKQATYLVC